MLKLLPAIFLALFGVRSLQATVTVAVGTKDGVLVCEDTRITHTDQDNKQSFDDSVHKSQRHGKFGFSTAAGQLSHLEQEKIAGVMLMTHSFSSYDILAEIRSFFETSDIRQFDAYMAARFEGRLRSEFRKSSLSARSSFSFGPTRVAQIFLYWIDPSGEPKYYVFTLTDEFSIDDYSLSSTSLSFSGIGFNSTPPRIKGQFLLPSNFETSKPIVGGDGMLVYRAFASSDDEPFKNIRNDPEFKPFFSDFVSSDLLEPVQTTRAVKRLIKSISEHQDSVRAGIGVGPTCDCYLLHKDGVRDMSDEVEKADEQSAKRAAEAQRLAATATAPKTKKKSKK